eukprot:gene5101-3670_t
MSFLLKLLSMSCRFHNDIKFLNLINWIGLIGLFLITLNDLLQERNGQSFLVPENQYETHNIVNIIIIILFIILIIILLEQKKEMKLE